MGNKPSSSKTSSYSQSQDECYDQVNPPMEIDFARISKLSRAVTFDERVHLNRGGPLHDAEDNTMFRPPTISEFRPLQRAATYDPRVNVHHGKLKPSDVLYRRYFNALERRDSEHSHNLFRIPEQKESGKEAIVVVDPYTTGKTLAEKALERGYEVICLYSDTLETLHHAIKNIPQSLIDQYLGVIFHNGDSSEIEQEVAIQQTIDSINKLCEDNNVTLIGVLAGAESGVLMTDILSERMNFTTNGTEGSLARRNKYLMGEKVRAAGLRAVKQKSVTQWHEIPPFIESEIDKDEQGNFKVIVKPVQSAGSDDVFLCKNMEDVKRAFGSIQGKINGMGFENSATLVQEYLDGVEYVVDTMSRNGQHKVVAVWEYDKRFVNGASFVYYGVWLREASGPIVTEVCNYILNVVEAMGIKHGPGHAEVKLSSTGEPCLVEIGARCHGSGGCYLPIVDFCIGYNQVECTLDAYFDEEAFLALPERPSKLKGQGCECMFVSYVNGKMKEYTGLAEIQQMKSFNSQTCQLKDGADISITIDMYTTPGSVILIHEDLDVVEADYNRIRELEHEGLFTLYPPEAEKEVKIVVVVDPFSTGAVLAHNLTKQGYDCICVYSDDLENIAKGSSLIPSGISLEFAATIEAQESVQKTVELIREAARNIIKSKGAAMPADNKLIKTVMPGAELGVELADKLAYAMKITSNDFKLANARRNKYLMGETLRAAGIRAVKQAKAETWEEAEAFINEHITSTETFEVVLKPLEAAGTEDVVLCFSMEEAKSIFHKIKGKINGLGIQNTAVLVQEYLEGNEFVVDTVSRGGKHKVVAIWQYDKRRVNDAAFVYFGVGIRPAYGPEMTELINYQFSVLDALGIRNGPAHGEVKICKGSPVLIEVGSRCHGGEGAWIPIADHAIGYNQVEACIDAYLHPEKFEKLPDVPEELLAYGCEVMLVSYVTGILKEMPGLAEIEKMPSYVHQEIFTKPGDRLFKTVDMFTTPGSIILSHSDADTLMKDLNRIRELEVDGLYTLME